MNDATPLYTEGTAGLPPPAVKTRYSAAWNAARPQALEMRQFDVKSEVL